MHAEELGAAGLASTLLSSCGDPPPLCSAIPGAAGARKVYAVEATDMAKFAKRLVTAQGLEGTVEVIQGVIESVHIPEKVDIIISEWMVSAAPWLGAAACGLPALGNMAGGACARHAAHA